MEESLKKFAAEGLALMILRHGHDFIGTKAEMIAFIVRLQLVTDPYFLENIYDFVKGCNVSFINDTGEHQRGTIDSIDYGKKLVEISCWNSAISSFDLIDRDPGEVWSTN